MVVTAPTIASRSIESEPHRMQCMEVWGSNRAVDSGVIMAGLDAWVYSQPWRGDQSGGDVHFVSSCATGRITRLLLADVSGHGEVVGETAESLRRIMRRYVNHIEQQKFVRIMNRALTRIDDQRFATSVVASFFAPRSQLIVSNAGHPPPLLRDAGSGRWSYMTQNSDASGGTNALRNMPLGVDRDTAYDEQRYRLQVGDIVMLYTDALLEARDASGNQIGMDGLLHIVQQLSLNDPGTFVHRLQQHIASLHPENLSGDDLTIMLFRPNGIGGGSNFFTRAWAGLRILATAAGRLIGRRESIPWPELSLDGFIGVRLADRLRRVFGAERGT